MQFIYCLTCRKIVPVGHKYPNTVDTQINRIDSCLTTLCKVQYDIDRIYCNDDMQALMRLLKKELHSRRAILKEQLQNTNKRFAQCDSCMMWDDTDCWLPRSESYKLPDGSCSGYQKQEPTQ